jgi:hypothetical protein
MPLPRQTPPRELIRKFRALGFEGPHGGGKHPAQPLGVDLLKRILRQAGISEEEWLSA